MKRIKKFASLVLAMIMVLAMGITAFAQTKKVGEEGATITINNPAKGETYTIHKLFDATVTSDGKIAYQGTVPETLVDYFHADDEENITPTGKIPVTTDAEGNKIASMTEDLQTALEEWAENAPYVATADSDGDGILKFTGVPYGYYVITTTHESDLGEGESKAKAAITVTSTTPNASIYDKNVNEPSVNKEVEKESYSIGDTVKYTATFDTTNYLGEGEDSKQVITYVISDTLPEFLSSVEVKKITVGGKELKEEDGKVQQFDDKKAITLPWATKNSAEDGSVTFTNKYAQGAQIVIEYEAVLTSITNINAFDTNTITIQPYVDNGSGKDGGDPWEEKWEDSAKIITYAAAINKVDEDDNPLAGAEFTIKGLTVEKTSDGVYTVVSYDPEAGSEVSSGALATDENGKLYIVGLGEEVTLSVTEVKAPNGYNKMVGAKELKPQVLSSAIHTESGAKHYDKDGNLVSQSSEETDEMIVTRNLEDLDFAAVKILNERGTLLPSTGGIGTTIFYVVGGILVIGAGIILVAKKRMGKR